MPNFKNLKELEDYMRKRVLPTAMEEVGEKIEDKLKTRITKDVYNSYTPEQYDRTYELRDSITSTEPVDISGTIYVEVKHDDSLIHAVPPNHHMSIVNNSDVSSFIGQWINYGDVPNIFNDRNYVWMNPRPYMDNTKEEIRKFKLLKKELKKSIRKLNIKTIED